MTELQTAGDQSSPVPMDLRTSFQYRVCLFKQEKPKDCLCTKASGYQYHRYRIYVIIRISGALYKIKITPRQQHDLHISGQAVGTAANTYLT